MHKIKPILTEKSLAQAKNGKYTFSVPSGLAKPKAKQLIEEFFGVTVREIRTMNYKPLVKTNIQKRKISVPGSKKVIVKLADKQTIDLFAEDK